MEARRARNEDVSAEQIDMFGETVDDTPTGVAPLQPSSSHHRTQREANHGEPSGASRARTTGASRTPDPIREPANALLWEEETPAQPDAADARRESESSEAASTEAASTQPAKRRAKGVLAAEPDTGLIDIASTLPPQVHLGTSTWSFPGWRGIVYADDYSNSKLSRDGLTAYGAHPLLRTVSIDRSFYKPLTLAEYLRYAQQVPEHFRFIVKAPALVTDATVRAERGEPVSPNPCFLNAQLAADEFVRPCIDGLGTKAGALVFQFSPFPDTLLAQPAALIERLAAFLAALPALPDGSCYAVEIRDACLLTPRFVRMLKLAGVRYCIGLHARMPDTLRQAAALALLDEVPAGPLIVRWSLHSGFKYEQAKAKYDPFDQLVDEDPATRTALAELAARYAIAGQPVLIAVNNKAEGSAPLSCVELAREIAAACARLSQ
ncbi:DUF72 domain-containing protein [Paraburkholderia rhizosphaerae]|uniref:Uncharacterized protein YecE (DUF72 family) n=1 Tax=Paraburkholderia rhizosphaerae TaxID=480658 RepID=A0A4R8LXZ7_9BURK|nr:DUF72 domain-containing protein [Paraburkholderia rhizosphaerae]TDY53233.1 uncharacterized protein YecE (DUF72 family) [Paraburkholderia rhizosphaerae]